MGRESVMAGGDAVPDGTRIGAQLGAQLRAARLAKEAESADAAPKTKRSPKQAR